MTHYVSLATRLMVALALLVSTSADLASQATPAARKPFDREYTLESSILGYRGVGGEIDGIRNPTIWALTGETVRITIVNAELMVHDVALEKHAVKSPEILDKGATTNLTFKAEQSDTYYCSIPGHRAAGMEGRIDVSETPRVQSDGLPASKDDRALNLDFEKGSLDDWTPTGDAFTLVKGEPPPGPPAERRSGWSGTFWISSGMSGSARKGTLSSTPFRVSHPYASFLVSGGAFASTRVELVLAQTKEVVYTISGAHSGLLRPAVVDLRAHAGKDIFVRLVDEESGASTATYIKENPWAHINFDHFRFHDSRPFFPNEAVPEDFNVLPPMDPVMHAGLSGEAAAKAMRVPKGFSVKLAAAEPDVVRPIAFTLDDRGRLWVAEAHTYPLRAREGQGRDRILIFEDTDGDGRLDRRKVFIENLNLISGLEVGFGGVCVGRRALPAVHPGAGGRRPAVGPAADPARRLGLSGHARDAEHVHVGTGRLALRDARRLHALERRKRRRHRRGTAAAERRDLAVSPDQARLRSVRRGHQQPVGPRLQRLRPRVHDRVRHPAPLPRRPGRAVQAPGRQAFQPGRSTTTSRPSPITCTGWDARDRMPATAAPTRRAAGMRTPAR